MEPKKPASVQELRAVFTTAQLSVSTTPPLESQSTTTIPRTDKNEEAGQGEAGLQKNEPVRHSLKKPAIGPKPNSAPKTSKPGFKSLVAALEGSHGMYTLNNMPRKYGLTVKDVQENLENSPPRNTVTSKLVKKEARTLSTKPPLPVSDADVTETESSPVCEGSATAVEQETSLNNNNLLNETEPKNLESPENASVNKTNIVQRKNQESPENASSNKTYIVQRKNPELCESALSRDRESMISTDNYVYKQRAGWKRRHVPRREELGPAPPKPPRVPWMRLPLLESDNNNNSDSSFHSSSGDSLPPPVPNRNPSMLERPPTVPFKPPRALPKAPSPTSPSPTGMADDLSEEEEIYNDVIFNPDSPTCKTTSDIEEDIYDDHSPQFPPSLPRYPPPLPPSTDHLPLGYSHPSTGSLQETAAALPGSTATGPSSLNNDSSENEDTDGIYEEAPVGPEYMNTEEVSQDKNKKRKKKPSLKTEQKTLEKIEKKREKFMKKFMLSGEEIPLDAGTVKNDSKGNKFDLNVTKGETVLILRMENNPSGKWLAKNGKGRVGYVELTNIQVDVESVKSVMTARTSQLFQEAFCVAPPLPD